MLTPPKIPEKEISLPFDIRCTESELGKKTDLALSVATCAMGYFSSPTSTLLGACCAYFFGSKKIELLKNKKSVAELLENKKLKACLVTASLVAAPFFSSSACFSLGFLLTTRVSNWVSLKKAEKEQTRQSNLQKKLC